MGIHISQIRNKHSFLKLSLIPITKQISLQFVKYSSSNPKLLFILVCADDVLVSYLSLDLLHFCLCVVRIWVCFCFYLFILICMISLFFCLFSSVHTHHAHFFHSQNLFFLEPFAGKWVTPMAQSVLHFRKRREKKHPTVLFLHTTLIDLLRRTRQSILKAIMLFHFDICSKVMVSIINNVISDHFQSIVLCV